MTFVLGIGAESVGDGIKLGGDLSTEWVFESVFAARRSSAGGEGARQSQSAGNRNISAQGGENLCISSDFALLS